MTGEAKESQSKAKRGFPRWLKLSIAAAAGALLIPIVGPMIGLILVVAFPLTVWLLPMMIWGFRGDPEGDPTTEEITQALPTSRRADPEPPDVSEEERKKRGDLDHAPG